MALFGNKDGGVMDTIRCDEQDYLIWKWHPKGTSASNSQRANAIRWGSSLRVRDGSVAVFVYPGGSQDYIEGPCDIQVETQNLPILSTLIGTLYDGGTPFQAEVYFINLADLIQVKFGVPYFDVFDPRFTDYGIPTAVRGSINFKISNYIDFIKLHRLDNFDLPTFQNQIKDTVVRLIKEVVTNAPNNDGIPAVQIERHLSEINALVEAKVVPALYESYGVSVTRVDVADIEVDKNSPGYKKLQSITQNKANVFTQAAANIVDTMGTHRIGAKRISQTVREEGKQIEPSHKLEEVGKNVSGAIGEATDAIGGFLGGLNKKKGTTPPPLPITKFYIALNNEQAGPFSMDELMSLTSEGTINPDTLVWKEGMDNWQAAHTVNELTALFNGQDTPTPPPIV